MVIDKIISVNNISTILEIDCGWGPNLELLSKHYSENVKIYGLDISPASIAEGEKQFSEKKTNQVELTMGSADNLPNFNDLSVDVVFTDAVLLYVGPDKIRQCVNEMLRITRQRIFLLEFHQSKSGAKEVYETDGWVRNYQSLLSPIVGHSALTITALPQDLCPSGRWTQYANLIEIDIKKSTHLSQD